ncbi:hypothetical protein [Hyalangium rubrum]|uniref:Circularly permuted ATPgrasp domain-containing protein n=1 Tax=Hyalangium rubrum TaxID=3103134 RepID=A0ABU5H0X8_9BACT|nr:hypothetical protein [Hyalangium sp. s54d21]MDY7226408.1 hypothetical protein [Hyalangium sp. s54d21]
MHSDFRRLYNQVFSPELYEQYRNRLQAVVGPVPYRLAESPLFIPPATRDRIFRYTQEIIEQLAEPERLDRARTAVPPEYDVPNQDAAPDVMTVDFAVVRGPDGQLDGQVVELQAFPSLFAFTMIQARIFNEMVKMPEAAGGFHCFAPGFDFDSAHAFFRRALLGGFSPEEVVLLEIEPDKQKTRPDFVATQELTGIEPVCVTEVIREGRQLFRMKDGRKLRIRRIYNRVVFDELQQKKPPMAFKFTDDLDVSWCPHPNWYWMWSKFSLPLLDHPSVPKATPLSQLQEVPTDLERYVLKPLFSYAGAGVKVDPTAEDIAGVPADQREGWILQQKINYARELFTPEGHGVAAEIRVLCLRDEGQRLPQPFMNLVRLSRGKMLGIDFNKGLDWVGSSVALWPKAG